MRLFGILPCALVIASCGGPKEANPPKKPVVSVRTALAESAAVDLLLQAPASIFPREQANITPRLTGVIRTLAARKGDVVSAGKLLVTQENPDLASQRAEAQALLADARANLEKTRSGTLPTDLERAKGQVEITRAALTQAQKIYDRRKSLFEQGAIPNRDLLLSETELATAKTSHAVAVRSLDLLTQQSQGQDLKMAEARVDQAKNRLAAVTAQLRYSELHAPFSGVITEQYQYAGDLGQPSTPIFTLMDLSAVSARAQVPEADAGQIHLGQPCEFHGEGAASGKVTVINRAVDPQRRTVEVWCEIGRPPAALRAASFGTVSFRVGRLDQTILVPASALHLEEGSRKGFVLIVDDRHTARRREVEAGEARGDQRVVLNGLKAGERVVLEGSYELPDGTPVKEQE